jgi:MrcB-like, N-terminal domain/Domain of unknown function (DUF3883)
MKEILQRICALQPHYSSQNTPEMQERGRLIRKELVEAMRLSIPNLQPAFDEVFDDLAVEGSDGIGRKTEAPWVRLYSKSMSPSPREGFYLVIHFAADGASVFITLGCGGTVWQGGDLTPVSDKELNARTSWARSVVRERWSSLHPMDDEMNLGARASLPRTFEKATVLAKHVGIGEIYQVDLESIFFCAAERLGEIYLAQMDRRDISPGETDAEEVQAVAKPLSERYARQGRGLSAADRRIVELRAMQVALEHLGMEGFKCKDTSATEAFDILAIRAGTMLKIEVKGTTSDLCDSVMMTRNEVDLHRAEKGSTALFIVSRIRLLNIEGVRTGSGGVLEAMYAWDMDKWNIEPIAYQLTRKSH